MRPRQREQSGSEDFFRARLDQVIDMRHELVQLAGRIDWDRLDRDLARCFSREGRPGTESRFMLGLLLLKHIYNLSDEQLCARWVENPYFQYFTGEEFFQHRFPHERSGLSHWRHRLGERLEVLLAESLRVAQDAGALKPGDLERIIVDTTVQPKNVTFPTDAKLMLRAIEKLGALAKRKGVRLRQSYVRVAKRAALMVGRYAHAKQFNRRNRALRFLRARLGRLIRDIERKIAGTPALQPVFAEPLRKAERILSQQQRARGPKLYSWHAPEVECIGKAKPHRPYEFGVKASFATTNRRAKGGQFVLHAMALPGNPYDGHTLATVIERTQALTGRGVVRAYVDKGYRGHTAPPPCRVFISGHKRGVHGVIARELKRRPAIEPVIGHMKADDRLGRNFLHGSTGDRVNPILCAVGYNFRLILAWLRHLLRLVLAAIHHALIAVPLAEKPS